MCLIPTLVVATANLVASLINHHIVLKKKKKFVSKNKFISPLFFLTTLEYLEIEVVDIILKVIRK